MFIRIINTLLLVIGITVLYALPEGGLTESTATTSTSSTSTSTTSTSSTSTSTSTTSSTTTTTDPLAALRAEQARINNLTYTYGEATPAMEAFASVARARGWSDQSIAEWSPFLKNVMMRESGYCYNVRRGATFSKSVGCVLAQQGPHSDSGFGQVISIHYKPGAWLCEQESLCSADDIVATPWASMTALVALLERNGRQPWCFTNSLRATAVCRNAPANPPTQ